MRRFTFIAFVLGLAAPSLFGLGGFTTVTGTITDPNGLKWSCGFITAQLITAGGPGATLNGGGFTTETSPVQLGCPTSPGTGPNGSFVMRLADSGVIVPSNTTWRFTVNLTPGIAPPAGSGPQSFSYTTAINCSTNTPATCTSNQMDISTQLSALAPALSSATSSFPLTTPAIVGNGGSITPTGTGSINAQGINILSQGAIPGKTVGDGAMTTTSTTFSAAGNSTSPATPAGTTTFNNETVVSIYEVQAAFTPPGTPTFRSSVAYSAGNNMGIWMGDQTVASAGAYAANTGTVPSTPWVAAAIPLIPTAGQNVTFRVAATATAVGSSVNTVFAATNGDLLIACISGFTGYSSVLPPNWNLIVSNVGGGTQNLTCAVHLAGPAEPVSYTFSGAGTFLAMSIVAYFNVAAIDNKLTSATANFSQADVGKTICAEGLNSFSPGFLSCGIIGLVSNATTIYPLFTNTLTSAASSDPLMWGVDSTAGLTGAIAALGSLGGNVIIPPGIYFVNAGQVKLPYNIVVNIIGSGAQSTIGFGTLTNAAGGSFIIDVPDINNSPLIGYVLGPGTGGEMFQTNDMLQGFTIRSNKTGTGNCIVVAGEFTTIQKVDLIGCGGDAIQFVANNTIYSGLNTVRDNFIIYSNNWGVEIASSTVGSNYIIERNEMDYNIGGGVFINGQQQVTISNNQLQFGGPAVSASNTLTGPVAIGPSNWIDGPIQFNTAGGQGPDIFDNYFELPNMIKMNGQLGTKITGNFFFAGAPFNASSTQNNVTFDATNVGAGMTTTFSGTSGTASCAYNIVGGSAKATCALVGYANTGAAQTWTYVLPMITVPIVTESAGSCGTWNPSSTATTLTLPQNAAMTAETCQILVEGQTN